MIKGEYDVMKVLEERIRDIYDLKEDFMDYLLVTQDFLIGQRDQFKERTFSYERFEFLIDLISEIIHGGIK